MRLQGVGAERDAVAGAKWARKAADAGLAKGMLLLAQLYDQGVGVTSDEKQAAQWVVNACKTGDPASFTALGNRLMSGKGVPRDPASAIKLFQRAADGGNTDAAEQLRKLQARQRPENQP